MNKKYKQFIQDHSDWLNSKREEKPKGKDYKLKYANLNGTNLSCADLEDTDLSGAELKHANLTNAYLNRVCLENAKLKNAYFKDTNLYRARIDLWESDIIALTKPLIDLMLKYNKEELMEYIKELKENGN